MTALSASDTACDCGHDVIWHHESRGCGYLGYGDRRCGCLLASVPVVEQITARHVAAALTAVADEIEAAEVRARSRSERPSISTTQRDYHIGESVALGRAANIARRHITTP